MDAVKEHITNGVVSVLCVVVPHERHRFAIGRARKGGERGNDVRIT